MLSETSALVSFLPHPHLPPSAMCSPLQKPWPAQLDYLKQSVEVPGTRRPGQTGM